MQMYWYNKSGMIEMTDEDKLEDEEFINQQIEEMTDEWGAYRMGEAQHLMSTAQVGEELIPLNEEEMLQMEDSDLWTLQYILVQVLELESGPY